MKKVLLWSVLCITPFLACQIWAEEPDVSDEAMEHGEQFLEMVDDAHATFDMVRQKVKTLYNDTIYSFDADAEKVVHDIYVLNAHVTAQIKNLVKCLKASQTDRYQKKVDLWLTRVTRTLFEGNRRRANHEFRKLSMAIRDYNQYFDRMIWAEQYYNWKYCGAPEPTNRMCSHEPCAHCDYPENCLDRPF